MKELVEEFIDRHFKKLVVAACIIIFAAAVFVGR